MRLRLDMKSWLLGYNDAKAGTREHEHDVTDALAYESGWIDGEQS